MPASSEALSRPDCRAAVPLPLLGEGVPRQTENPAFFSNKYWKDDIMKKDELFASLAVIAFFSFMLIQAAELKFVRRVGDMGSGFWPILVLSAATLLSILVLLLEVRKNRRERKALPEKPSGQTVDAAELKMRRTKLVLSVICLLVYIVIMPYIGFVLATLFYVLAFILSLGERRRWVLSISPFLVTAMAVAVFGRFIAMPLPRGIGAFAAFSRVFY